MHACLYIGTLIQCELCDHNTTAIYFKNNLIHATLACYSQDGRSTCDNRYIYISLTQYTILPYLGVNRHKYISHLHSYLDSGHRFLYTCTFCTASNKKLHRALYIAIISFQLHGDAENLTASFHSEIGDLNLLSSGRLN